MYIQEYIVEPDHIDFQGVVDGLYYNFYMEWCRHSYLKEIIGIDIEEEFEKGYEYVVTNISTKFIRSIYINQKLRVSSELVGRQGKFRFIFYENIIVDDIICAESRVTAVCLYNKKPYLPPLIEKNSRLHSLKPLR